MERRENDMFMSMLANPNASFNNIVVVGLTADNTSLQDKNTYINNKYVQEKFKNSDGDFDKLAFDKFYDTAKLFYNNLANANYSESVKRQARYHRDSILAPKGQRLSGPMFEEVSIPNPYQQVFNLTQLGRIDDPTKSYDELAQSHKILENPTTAGDNLENAIWGEAPNDNFFGNFFNTLVMAQYDEDGFHTDPITGNKVEHKKGDLKTNQDGEFYYEKLDGRDVYGRRVLNKMNVITTDGSFWNKLDFFDSDDIKQKNVGASILKNAALVGTMFIPYVGPYIAGLSVATQLAGLGATFGKMLVGSNSPTLSAIEGWSKSMNRQTAKSQYAQENTWCWENFIDLIGDVMGQLKEQRFIFEKIPAISKGTDITNKVKYDKKLEDLKNVYLKSANEKFEILSQSGLTNNQLLKACRELNATAVLKAQSEMDSFVKGYQKIGEILSKGYMTGITVADTYGEAKQAGASDLDATLLTLGYSAGEYALLNTGIGEWILPELRADRYKSKAIAKAIINLGKETNDLRASLSGASKEAKKSYVKRLFNIGKNIANAEYVDGTRSVKASFAAGLGEGIEEVSEELLADFSKGCYDVVKWLQGDNTRLNSFGYNFSTGEWDSKDILDRYGMSLIGGFVGGSITNSINNYKSFKQLSDITPQQSIQELVYMGRNGQLENFLKQVDKMELGNKNLSATDFEIKNGQILFAPGTETNNQDLFAKQAIKQQVQLIQNILEANGANLSDESFLDIQTLKDLRFNSLYNSTTAGSYINEFNTLSSKLIKLESDLQNKLNSSIDSNKDGVVEDKEKRRNQPSNNDEQLIQNINKEITDTKKQLSDLLEGKRSYEFISDALFEMTPDLSGLFTSVTFPLYAENKYNKKFKDLTENEKAVTWKEYQEWKSGEGREQIINSASIYRRISQLASDAIKRHLNEYSQIPLEIKKINALVSRLYNNINGIDESSWLENAQNIQNGSEGQLKLGLVQQFANEQEKADVQNLLDKINKIDPSDESKKKELSEQLVNKYSEILLNNISDYLKPLFDSKTANSETKNQLNNILVNLSNIVKYRLDKSINEQDPFDPNSELEIKKWEDKLKEIKSLKDKIQALNNTAFEKNLNEFSISIGNNPINITTLIERLNASFNSISDNITQFNIDEQLYKDLDNAINTIIMYQAAIKGARTDGAEYGNYFGYNATLNEINKKLKDKRPELAEIDKNIADVFIADINTNLNKLLFLRQLFRINQGQKLSKQDRISTKKDLLIYKKLKSIVQVPDNDKLKSWDGFLELSNVINSMKKHEELLSSNKTNLNESDRIEFEREKIQAEDAIYDFFQKNKEKLNDPEKLSEFLSPSRFNFYTQSKELLNENLDNLDDNSMIWWIASRAAIKSSDFYKQYSQIIDTKSDNPIAPIATQELAVFNCYASIMNGNVIDNFYNAFRLSVKNDWNTKSVEDRKKILKSIDKSEEFAKEGYTDYLLNFLPVPRYSNSVLVEGIAGSGKTSAVFKQLVLLLKGTDLLKDVAIVHGANKDSAIKIQESIGLDNKNSKTYGLSDFLKEISAEWHELPIDPKTEAQIVPKNNYQITDENEIISSLGIKSVDKYPSLIIIDEVQKFNGYDFDLINKFAKKYGITVVVAGDFDQTGVIGKHPIQINNENITWNIELSRTNFVRTPKLGVSMRTDNSVKTHNQQKLQAYMQNPNNEVIEFEYLEDETGLYGDKVIQYEISNDKFSQDDLNNDKQSVVKNVQENIDNIIKTLKPGEKIGYIYNDIESPIYKLLSKEEYSKYIDFKQGSSALGLEGRYYIIEVQPNSVALNSDELSKYLKKIYTGITRAQQGSLVIVPANIGIKLSTKKIDNKISEKLNTSVINSYANKRKELLEKVASDGKQINYQPRNTDSTITINNNTVKTKGDTLSNGIANTSNNVKSPKIKPTIIVKDDTTQKKPSNNYEDISLSDCPNDIQSKLLDIQKNAINNPKTDDGFDVDDSKTDLKYGQIIRIGNPENNQFGVIFGVKYNENSDHEYLVTKIDGSIDTISSKNITAIVNTSVKQEVVLSHDDMVKQFGEIANIDSITIDLNGQKIQFPICQIPFKNDSGESGYNNIINYYGQNIVVVNINGIHMPFYMNSNYWNPFFGIDATWLNKGGLEQENQYYGSKILELIAKQLDDALVVDGSVKGPEVAKFDKSYPQIDFINQDMKPISNDESDYLQKFNDNVQNTLQKIDDSVNSLMPKNDTPEPERLIHEDNPLPFINEDVIPEEKYKEILDNTNDEEEKPLSKVEDNEIHMLLHSFNTFETGVIFDDNGNIIIDDQNRRNARIDSVNGLIKIDNLLGRGCKTIDEYIKIIGNLRSLLFNINDKSELIKRLEDYLELPNVNITFALKSTPTVNIKSGNKYGEKDPSPFNKNVDETTLVNGSYDVKSHEWNNHQIVAIISTNGKNILELPLLVLSSPFTLIQTKTDGELVYPDVYNYFEQLQNQGMSIHDISVEIIHKFKDKYPRLTNLFRLFNFTYRGITFIKDPHWTIAKNLELLGPQFVVHKGNYQIVDGYNFDENGRPEVEWEDVSNLKNNKQINMTDILVSIDGTIETGDGRSIQIVNPGHSFVLISYDLDLDNQQKIIDYYIKQVANPDIPQKVKLMYVLPPKSTLREYIENLRQILKGNKNVDNIGQLFTCYKLLKILIQDDTFKQILNRKIPGALEKIQNAVERLDNLPDNAAKRDELYTPYNWSDIGLPSKPIKLDGLFTNILVNTIYDKNTINGLIGSENSEIFDNNTFEVIQNILEQSGINGVYYNVKINSSYTSIGPFISFGKDKYDINNKPFKIHGKLDSYVFRGSVDNIVYYFVKSINQDESKNDPYFGNKDIYDYLSYKQYSPKNNTQDNVKDSIINYIKDKTGIDASNSYSNMSIEEGNLKVLNTINSSTVNHIAFLINGELKISNSNNILGESTILYDANDNPINDITSTVDNNGVYHFKLETNDKMYFAEYNDRKLILTPVENIERLGSNSITEDNFKEFKNDLDEIPNLISKDELDSLISFSDLLDKQNYDDFITYIKEDEDIEGELEDLSQNEDEKIKNIANQILELKKYLDENESSKCMENIEIIF